VIHWSSLSCIHTSECNPCAFVCSAGQRDLADRWYERLYHLGFITHWLSREDPDKLDCKGRPIRVGVEDAATRSVLDLQGFSRGMTYAALRSAIEEVRCWPVRGVGFVTPISMCAVLGCM
jgi:hypothetical protein